MKICTHCCRVYDRQDGFLWARSGNAARRVGETEKKGGATKPAAHLALDTVERGTRTREFPSFRNFSFCSFFRVLICSFASRQRILILYLCTVLCFFRSTGRQPVVWSRPFRVASRQLATCWKYSVLNLISCLFVSGSRGVGNILVHRPGIRIPVPFRPSSRDLLCGNHRKVCRAQQPSTGRPSLRRIRKTRVAGPSLCK